MAKETQKESNAEGAIFRLVVISTSNDAPAGTLAEEFIIETRERNADQSARAEELDFSSGYGSQ